MIETIKVAAQWLFTPLLVIVVLAWLCLRIEASGTFGAIRDIVRKMSVFQRFAAAAFLAVFIVFAGEKTNSPPANLPPTILPSVPPLLPEPPRSGESEVTNLCFTSISVVSGRKLPLVRIGRDKTCNIHDIIYLAPSDRNQRMCCLQYSANANRFNYRRGPWAMDSGHPLFILFGNELVFVCPTRGFYYSDNQATGFLCTYYKSLIQRAVDGLSDQHAITRMPIADFDFSQYGELYDMEMDP